LIGRLSGRIVEESADGTVVVDVAGVGYEVSVPAGTVGRAGADAGAVALFIHTHVREDALQLYGFASREDRSAFRALIAVSNVGPKIAMTILSVLDSGELAAAIARAEIARLTAIPGIGKKTAERLVLELKGKLTASVAAAPIPSGRAAPADSKSELLHGALTRMGFRPSEAERAIAALGPRVHSDPLGDLVREALALLSR
jgi:Holliday junction DNA helicase RuvA